jgi:hypothetical protein
MLRREGRDLRYHRMTLFRQLQTQAGGDRARAKQ